MDMKHLAVLSKQDDVQVLLYNKHKMLPKSQNMLH